MFGLIGVHHGPDITVPAAASLAGVSRHRARQALAELARACLIAEHAPGRYACHDLIRVYATERARADNSDTDRHAAVRRALDHYLHTANAASLLLHPYRDMVRLNSPYAGVLPEEMVGHHQALEWFQAEREVLLAAISRAAGDGFSTHAWQLPWAAAIFFDWRGHSQELMATQELALAAARQAGDRAGQAQAHGHLGQAQIRLGACAQASAHLAEALELGRQLGSSTIQAWAHLDLAWALELQDRCLDALRHARQSLQLYRSAGHPWGEAQALNLVGWCHARLGRHHEALDYCGRALALHRVVNNRRGVAATLDSLGYARHHLGHHTEAIACYQQALDANGDASDLRLRAAILARLGNAHQASGDNAAACRAWQGALAILVELHDPAAGQVRSWLAGHPAGDGSSQSASARG
jgi:tetratricopeptide (TPR) repeat protein